MIGKRKGHGKEIMAPHNLPLTVLGAGLLWFGWFGFNAGSALAGNALAASAFVATNTATAAAALGWMIVEWAETGRPTVLGAASGAVAGLVAITPAAGFVGPISSIILGFLAGVICYIGVTKIKAAFGTTTRSTSSESTASAGPGAPSRPGSLPPKRSTTRGRTASSSAAASAR